MAKVDLEALSIEELASLRDNATEKLAEKVAARQAELEAELIDYCRNHLASYKCPRTVDFSSELPRDPNGKLYKRLLRERYWEGHDTRLL